MAAPGVVSVPVQFSACCCHVETEKYDTSRTHQIREVDRLETAVPAEIDIFWIGADDVARLTRAAARAVLCRLWRLRPPLTGKVRFVVGPPIVVTGVEEVSPRCALICGVDYTDAALPGVTRRFYAGDLCVA